MIVLEISVTMDHIIECMFAPRKAGELSLRNPVVEAVKNVLPISHIDFRHMEFTVSKTWQEDGKTRTHFDQYVISLPWKACTFLEHFSKKNPCQRLGLRPFKFKISVPSALVERITPYRLDALIYLQAGLVKKVVQKFGQ